MRVAVSGASGLLGRALVPSLRDDGHDVVRLVRRPATAADELHWDPVRGHAPQGTFDGVDAVVNLAGAGVGDHRWTARYRAEIVRSRVDATTALAEALAVAQPRPKVLLSASAVGYYGDTAEPVTEESPPGEGFLPSTCVRWEAATAAAQEAGIRVAQLRSGIVLSRHGGALAKVLPLFRLGLGGRLGSGRQYVSWITRADHVAAMRFLLQADDVSGPVNLTAPEPVTNAAYTKAIGSALRRPTPWMVPGPAVRIVVGGFAGEVLGGQRVLPRRLLDAGFTWAHPTIESGVEAALQSPVDDH